MTRRGIDYPHSAQSRVAFGAIGLLCLALEGCSGDIDLPKVQSPSARDRVEPLETPAEIMRAESIGYCNLVASGPANDGKLVRVSGRYLSAFETSILQDLPCLDRQMWVEFDRPSVEILSRSGGLGVLDHEFQQASS